MELYEILVEGYRKFRSPTRLKTHGKLVALLGANEAGKTSLLAAIHRLNDLQPFSPAETSHDLEADKTSVTARFLLDESDFGSCGIRDTTWFSIEKSADGTRYWDFEPTPIGRPTAHRARLNDKLARILAKEKFVNAVSETDADFFEALLAIITSLNESDEDADSGLITQMKGILERVDTVASDSPRYFKEFAAELREAVSIEETENTSAHAAGILLGRIPKFLMFGAEDRDLKSAYTVEDLASGIPRALMNLMEVAECDIEKLLNDYANQLHADVDTAIDNANEKLAKKFKAVWKQSAVAVAITLRDQVLSIQVRNPDRRTSFDERSDGLRQFVALQSFTTCRGLESPVLLIDEAEQHLHYDAQADLIQMLASQTIAPKVIYTTHSAGCLPEDLGNGVRLVTDEHSNSDWSVVRNKFWESHSATFSPLLIGMGASTMAFFPTRAAVLVEGESDMLLLPSMFRKITGTTSIGFQFVPGLGRVNDEQLPLLDSCGPNVCYLVDGDKSGRDQKRKLLKLGVGQERIFELKGSGSGSCELEDFLEKTLLIDAVNELARRHHEIEGILSARKMPTYGKWKHVVESLKARSIEPLLKVDVAYEVLDLMSANPARTLIEPRLEHALGQVVRSVMTHFERLELERQRASA